MRICQHYSDLAADPRADISQDVGDLALGVYRQVGRGGHVGRPEVGHMDKEAGRRPGVRPAMLGSLLGGVKRGLRREVEGLLTTVGA